MSHSADERMGCEEITFPNVKEDNKENIIDMKQKLR